jgi:hypothetical protein
VPCIVLVRTSDEDKIATKGGGRATNFFVVNSDSLLFIRNLPFESFVGKVKAFLVAYHISMPFVDATNYSGSVDLSMDAEVFDQLNLPLLRKELAKYDLDLVKKDYVRDILVIKEKQRSNDSASTSK